MLHIFQNYKFIITVIARYLFLKCKDLIQNAQNRRSGGKANRIYETHKNTVMPYGHHIYAKEYDMSKPKMCAYSQSDHALPHCKCVLRCCAKCPSINIPDQETYDQYPDTSPSISFHIYCLIGQCTKHGRLPLSDKLSCLECQHYTASVKPTKIFTRSFLVYIFVGFTEAA